MMESEGSPRIYRVHHVDSLCRRRKASKEARRTLQQSCSLAFYRPVRWKTFVLIVRAANTCRKVMGEGGVRVGALIAPLAEELGIRKAMVSFARGAPVSLHASAALLEGEELVLEDASSDCADVDSKMSIVKKMLKTEEVYCRTVKSVAQLYEATLRKLLSLTEDDHKKLFDWVDPLCTLSNLFIFKLHSSLEEWDQSGGRIDKNECPVGKYFCKETTADCMSGDSQCDATNYCLAEDKMCNGIKDCKDNSDENFCYDEAKQPKSLFKKYCHHGEITLSAGKLPLCKCEKGYSGNRCSKQIIGENNTSPADNSWIAGVVIGVLLLIAIIIVVTFQMRRRRQRVLSTPLSIENPVYGFQLETRVTNEDIIDLQQPSSSSQIISSALYPQSVVNPLYENTSQT